MIHPPKKKKQMNQTSVQAMTRMPSNNFTPVHTFGFLDKVDPNSGVHN
jgi:hypothetical protein